MNDHVSSGKRGVKVTASKSHFRVENKTQQRDPLLSCTIPMHAPFTAVRMLFIPLVFARFWREEKGRGCIEDSFFAT